VAHPVAVGLVRRVYDSYLAAHGERTNGKVLLPTHGFD
jgi:hypothetical protein